MRLYKGDALVRTFRFSEGKAAGHFYGKSKRADVLRATTRRVKVKPRWYVFSFTCESGGTTRPLVVAPWNAEPAGACPTPVRRPSSGHLTPVQQPSDGVRRLYGKSSRTKEKTYYAGG